MKRILATGITALISAQASAGSITYEAPTSIVVVEPTMGMGSGSWIIPLVIIAVLGLAIANKNYQ